MFIFKRDEIVRHVKTNRETVSVVEAGFNHLAAGNVEMPPIMRIDIPENNGEVDVKSAYIRGLDVFAIKISAGFFNNAKLGLPSGNGMMLLISTETGEPRAVLSDNGYLTDVRTAAAGAVAAEYLAKKEIGSVGVIGSGTQAGFQLQALKTVRDFRHVRVYGRTAERARLFAEDIRSRLGVEVTVCTDPEPVVRQSDLVVTATPSKSPLIKAEWLHPGLHITAMGSDAEYKQELEAQVFTRSDLIVCDVLSQCVRLGEIHHAVESGSIQDQSGIVELGEITSGQKKGRTNDRQITVCDLTGTGVQDTAIAQYAYTNLLAQGCGMEI